MTKLRSKTTWRAVAALGLLSAGTIFANPITYLVTIDTSAVQGSSGFLDFDFAPGNGSQGAFVTIADFSPGGSLSGLPQVNGDVSGSLPGTLRINNTTQFNDYFEGFTYGTTLSFQLSFGGPALTAPDGTSLSGSTFGFGMFDSTGLNPLLTTDPNGNTFLVNVNLDGSTTVATFASDASGGGPVATIAAVPEPSMFCLVLLSLAAVLSRKRRDCLRAPRKVKG